LKTGAGEQYGSAFISPSHLIEARPQYLREVSGEAFRKTEKQKPSGGALSLPRMLKPYVRVRGGTCR